MSEPIFSIEMFCASAPPFELGLTVKNLTAKPLAFDVPGLGERYELEPNAALTIKQEQPVMV